MLIQNPPNELKDVAPKVLPIDISLTRFISTSYFLPVHIRENSPHPSQKLHQTAVCKSGGNDNIGMRYPQRIQVDRRK